MPIIFNIHPEKEELSKLRHILQGRDFTIREFSDGLTAEAELKIMPPDICLLPIGIEASENQTFIDVLNKELPECPIIILADKGQVNDAVKMLGSNSVFDYFLLNPIINPVRLHIIIDKALTQSIIQLNLENLKKRLSKLPDDLPSTLDEQAKVLKDEMAKKIEDFKKRMKSSEFRNIIKLIDEKAFDSEFDRFHTEQVDVVIDQNRSSISETISSRLRTFNNNLAMQFEARPTIESLLELRRQLLQDDPDRATKPSSKQDLLQNIKKSVLLITENGYPPNALISIIEKLGYSVLLAQSPKRTMELLRAQKVDMLICGYDLGDTNGIELVRELRANSSNKELPVILVTRNPSKDIETQSKEIGIQDILTIPFLPKTVQEKVNFYLKAS